MTYKYLQGLHSTIGTERLFCSLVQYYPVEVWKRAEKSNLDNRLMRAICVRRCPLRKTLIKLLFARNPFLHYSAKLMGAAGIEPASSAVLP